MRTHGIISIRQGKTIAAEESQLDKLGDHRRVQ